MFPVVRRQIWKTHPSEGLFTWTNSRTKSQRNSFIGWSFRKLVFVCTRCFVGKHDLPIGRNQLRNAGENVFNDILVHSQFESEELSFITNLL